MNYRSQLDEFARRFYSEGPGAVGEDLDKGEVANMGVLQVWGFLRGSQKGNRVVTEASIASSSVAAFKVGRSV